jgi:hypothetical protein
MTRRALLIGSQTFGLTGVNADVVLVDRLLAAHGFERRVILDHAATRDGILSAFKRLIEDTQPGDPVVLYYSGHGGRIANRNHTTERPHEPRHYACIIPFDHEPTNFRGIFSAELSALLAQLALRTANITTLFDCCHAADQIKAEGSPRRTIPVPWNDTIAAHREHLINLGYDLSARAAYVEGNPHAVRLHACAAEQSAYESQFPDGSVGGLFTRALVNELALAEPHVTTWLALAERIRATVRGSHPTQVPELHGPTGRTLFSADALPLSDVLALVARGGHPYLSGGALQGVTPGSRYLLMPLNANRADLALALAEAEVLDVDPSTARIALRPLRGAAPPPAGTLAFLYRPQHHRHRIELKLPPGPLHDRLSAAITASPRLTLTAAPNVRPLATLTQDPRGLHLHDRDGHLLYTYIYTHTSTSTAPSPVPYLEQLARIRDLIDHSEPVEDTRLNPPPTLRWVKISPPPVGSLPERGAALDEGDRISVKITNHSSAPIYVHIIEIGVSRTITLRTTSQPYGVQLCPQETYTLGQDLTDLVPGIPLTWPEHLPRSAPQPLALLVLWLDQPVDLRSLESTLPPRPHPSSTTPPPQPRRAARPPRPRPPKKLRRERPPPRARSPLQQDLTPMHRTPKASLP